MQQVARRSRVVLVGTLALALVLSTAACGGDDELVHQGQAVEAPLSGGQTPFWVVMKARADLSAAPGIQDHAARGQFVADKLRAVAKNSQAGVLAYVKGKGLPHQPFWIVNAVRVTADDATAKLLSLRPDVDRILPDGFVRIPEPTPGAAPATVGATWGIVKIGADQVWQTFGTGQGIVIGSIDTGVDYTHPALVGHYRGNNGDGAFSHDYNWWDPAAVCVPAGVPCDNNAHGTHTVGTMLGGDGLGPFVEDIGVAPGATWIAAKGCESGSCSYASLLSSGQFMLAPTRVDGLDADPQKRPHIVSNSWSGGAGDSFFRDMVEAWVAAGIFPVFANGNSGPNCGTVGSPGDYPESFGVGATNSADGIAAFSSRGPSPFGVVKPDLSAPGVDVRSSVPGGGYASYNGTSMATPHVAGVVALVWSAAPSLVGDIPATVQLLRGTAVDLGDTSCGGTAGYDNVFGDGRIDALAAVQQAPRVAGTLQGTITSGGAPLAGATVRAVPVGGGYARTTTTGADGSYAMVLAVDPVSGERNYTVTVSAYGYGDGSATLTLVKDEITDGSFALTPAQTRLVSGTVRDEVGTALFGIPVEVVDVPVAPAVTNASGAYQLALPAGTYSLRTRDRCHEATTVSVTVADADLVRDLAIQTHYDAFGYHCRLEPSGYVPLATSLGLSGDDAATTVSLPFAFAYYGNSYGTLYASTNGVVNFLGLNTAYANGAIPASAVPNAAIYAFWDDLIVPAASPVLAQTSGSAPDRVWRLEYRQVGYYNDAAALPVTFQIELREGSGEIRVHYADMPGRGDGRSATVGLENANGTVGLQLGLNEAVLQSGTTLRFLPPAPDPPEPPEPPAAYSQAIEVAGTSPYTDGQGATWAADKLYSAGSYGYTNKKSTATSIEDGIAGTTDDALYATVRNNPTEYRFDGLEAGQYQVELRFVEPSLTVKEGQRVFDVVVEGTKLLPAHDIRSHVLAHTADDHVLGPVTVSDGQLNVRLQTVKGKGFPVLSAIRVTRLP